MCVMNKSKTHKCCDRCGKRLKPNVWIYSRFTGARYCTDINACDRRAKKVKKAA